MIKILCRKKYIRYTFFDSENFPERLFYYFLFFWQKWRSVYDKKISTYFGTPGFSIGSGRMALYLLLKAFGVGHGDEVILTGYTCVVCPNAVLYVGAKPVYVDIDKRSFGMDPALLENKLTSRTKAIVVQHTYGIPASIEEVVALAKKHKIPVIEDCAHSLGGTYKGKKLGSFGDAAFFSSDHTKMISTSTGGGLVLNNPDYLDKLTLLTKDLPQLKFSQSARIMFQYCFRGLMANPRLNWFGVYLSAVLARLGVYFYFYDENIERKECIVKYPYPVGLSNFQAYIGSCELDRLVDNLAHRSKVVEYYEDLFGVKYDGLPLLMYPLLVRNPRRWVEALGDYVEVFDWFSRVVYGKKDDLSRIEYAKGSCPVAENVARSIIALPTNRRIDEQALKLVKEIVRENQLMSDIIKQEESANEN